jgi:hypothetical protein
LRTPGRTAQSNTSCLSIATNLNSHAHRRSR